MKTLLLLVISSASCATVRPITYPSPCLDRGDPVHCMVLGYEVWGTPNDVHSQARECPDGTRAHVTIDPHRDYGVIRCSRPDQIAAIVEREKPPAPPDLEITLQETETPIPDPPPLKELPTVEPDSELRDQPRVEPAKKAKRKRKRMRLYND